MKKIPLILILTIGIATPLLSTALFYFWRPAAQVNIGEILPLQKLQPTRWRHTDGGAFDAQQWRGKWVLIVAGGGACDERCRQRLCQMRQLRLMLPGHYLKLRRVWAITDETAPPNQLPQETHCGEIDNPALAVKQEDTLAGVETLYAPASSLPEQASEYLYLIDPDGFWTMRFAPQLSAYEIRKDLKRLLSISKGRKYLGDPAPL